MTLVKDQQSDPDVVKDRVNKNKIYWNWLIDSVCDFYKIVQRFLNETCALSPSEVCLNLCKQDWSFATSRPRASTVACFQQLDLRIGHFGHLCPTQWRHPTVLFWTCQRSDHPRLHDLGNCWMGYFLAGPKVPKSSYKVINCINISRTINIKICGIVQEVALLGSVIA